MIRVYGLTGVIGSGKTFMRDELRVSHGCIPLDFKDALIDMVEDIIGFKIRDHYELFKECVVGTTNPACFNPSHRSAQQMTKEILAICPSALTGRQMLQNVGTDAMRTRDPDYWVKEWLRAADKILEKDQSIVCADVRFQNECYALQVAVRGNSATHQIIMCDYHSPRYDASAKHESERMAQRLLRMGYQHGQTIHPEDYERLG